MALTDQLVSFWELEEASGTRVDAHGANDLTDVNTVGSGTGKVGTAASFTAASSEELTNSDAAFSRGNADWAWAGWVNVNNGATGNKGPFQKGQSSEREYGCFLVSGAPWVRIYDSSNTLIGSANWAAALTDGVWYWLAAWLDTGQNKIFVAVNNGTPVGATLTGTPRSSTTADFRLGYFSGGDYWDGLVDQVGFWTRILTSQEMTDLYNSGNGLSYAAMAPSGAKPAAYYYAMAGIGGSGN